MTFNLTNNKSKIFLQFISNSTNIYAITRAKHPHSYLRAHHSHIPDQKAFNGRLSLIAWNGSRGAIARQLSLITCNFVARKQLSCRGIVQATHKRFSATRRKAARFRRKDYPPAPISNKANNSYNRRGAPRGRFNCALTGGILWRCGEPVFY